jgi:hypothetical protein
VKLGLAETAERLRKPESGSAVRLDSSPHQGAWLRMSLKSAETIGKSVPVQAPDSREVETGL